MSDGSARQQRVDAALLQRERMSAMSKLAAGVAHEINNPTGVLLMKLKFLLSVADQEGLSERAVATIRVAVEQTERIEGIVENLLSFSRVSEATPRRTDLHRAAEAAVRQLAPQLATGSRLDWQPAPGTPMVDADAAELQQVCAQLLDNAVYAAGPSGHVVMATTIDAEHITLTVRDDGPGIPEDFVGRIFDPFFTTRPVGEGTGLGLAIAYGIVQRYGGHIEVHSVRREGTTLTVRLPAVAASESAP